MFTIQTSPSSRPIWHIVTDWNTNTSVEYSFWFNSHASKNACAIHKIQTFEQPFLKLYFINIVRMNCCWLFLVLPWHLICARAVRQLGTDSKNTFCKTKYWKVPVKLRSFPTHDKKQHTDRFALCSTELNTRRIRCQTLCDKVTYWFCKEPRFCMWIFPFQMRTFPDVNYEFHKIIFNETFNLLQHLKKHSNGLYQLYCLLYIHEWQTVSLSSKSRS